MICRLKFWASQAMLHDSRRSHAVFKPGEHELPADSEVGILPADRGVTDNEQPRKRRKVARKVPKVAAPRRAGRTGRGSASACARVQSDDSSHVVGVESLPNSSSNSSASSRDGSSSSSDSDSS